MSGPVRRRAKLDEKEAQRAASISSSSKLAVSDDEFGAVAEGRHGTTLSAEECLRLSYCC
jgi:hypothetical protein